MRLYLALLTLLVVTSNAAADSLYELSSDDLNRRPRPNPDPTGVKDYDNYSLAIEWSGTVCRFKSCTEDNSARDNWNLHGLWPNKDDGNHPFTCTSTPLNFESLESGLRNDLNLYWSGLYSS
jgi:ribonuclease T2